MRKDKAFPFRVAFSLVLVILDFFIIPQVLSMLVHLKQGSILTFHWSILGGIIAIPTVKDMWLWLQPAVFVAIVWIWLAERSLLNVVYVDDQPRSAGHGQHGSARWMSPAEVDQSFSVHELPQKTERRLVIYDRWHCPWGRR